MNRLAIGAMLACSALAAPALAQNSSSTLPPAVSPPPKTEPAPAPTPPAAATPSDTVVIPEPAPRIVVQPVPQPLPQQPVTISPDAAYPNGFADPADPFANEARAYNDQGGFDWGLLGLLGLLGLIPLIRGNGSRTIYVERDEPRRVVRREERIED